MARICLLRRLYITFIHTTSTQGAHDDMKVRYGKFDEKLQPVEHAAFRSLQSPSLLRGPTHLRLNWFITLL